MVANTCKTTSWPSDRIAAREQFAGDIDLADVGNNSSATVGGVLTVDPLDPAIRDRLFPAGEGWSKTRQKKRSPETR